MKKPKIKKIPSEIKAINLTAFRNEIEEEAYHRGFINGQVIGIIIGGLVISMFWLISL